MVVQSFNKPIKPNWMTLWQQRSFGD